MSSQEITLYTVRVAGVKRPTVVSFTALETDKTIRWSRKNRHEDDIDLESARRDKKRLNSLVGPFVYLTAKEAAQGHTERLANKLLELDEEKKRLEKLMSQGVA